MLHMYVYILYVYLIKFRWVEAEYLIFEELSQFLQLIFLGQIYFLGSVQIIASGEPREYHLGEGKIKGNIEIVFN